MLKFKIIDDENQSINIKAKTATLFLDFVPVTVNIINRYNFVWNNSKALFFGKLQFFSMGTEIKSLMSYYLKCAGSKLPACRKRWV